jgi:hypothetical protein
MTAQIQNTLFYNDRKFSIIALQNELDYVPNNYGIEPDTSCSACWRGYYCKFGIINKQLVLMDWNIFYNEGDDAPILGNIKAIESTGLWKYISLDFPVQYNGGIVIGAGFKDEYYIHMGFQNVYAYEIVLELIFDNGILIDAIDHSVKIEQLRNNLSKSNTTSDEKIFNSISQLFSLRYEERWNDFVGR